MQIKKYLAETLKEASQKMKDELGDEAVVLSTRIIDSDPRFGNKRIFEITAGLEEEYEKIEELKPKQPIKMAQSRPAETAQAAKEPDFAEELKKLTEKIYAAKGKTQTAQVPPQPVQAAQPQLRKAAVPVKKEAPVVKKEVKPKPVERDADLERELKEVVETLYFREVQKKIIVTIVDQLKKYTGFLHRANMDSYVLSSIASMIPTGTFEVPKTNQSKVIALVGPTGVGKTTCIAKLAIISKILHNLDVGLISVDTYRLGAIDQLKIFSEVSNIDLLVAYTPDEIPKLLQTFKKKDVVFIDTAGRSQNNTESLKKTRQFLDAANASETFLVLNATSGSKNLQDVMEKYKILNYGSLIFTKIDEAAAYGNILNAVTGSNVPVKFLTNGQTIPDDIIAADPDFIAKLVYTGKLIK